MRDFPLITDICSALPRGGLACLGVGMQSSALVAGKMAGQVLRGENPKDMPIEEVAVEEVAISRSNAAQLGITIPPEFARNVRPVAQPWKSSPNSSAKHSKLR